MAAVANGLPAQEFPGYPKKFTYPSVPEDGNSAAVLGPTSLVWSVRHENMPGTISGTADMKPVMPVSVPTSAGTREGLDIGYPVLNLQKLENPQVSIHACKQKYGSDAVRNIFTKLGERGAPAVFEEINLSDVALGDDGAQFLSDGLSGNTSLKTLLMPRAEVRSTGFQAIGQLLGTLPNLEILVLSGNLGDPASGGEIDLGLSKNKSLKSICLAACRLQNTGVKKLCDGSLRQHPRLEHISLNYNRLEDEVCASVAQMLAVNSTLEYLELCGNSIGVDGARELLKGLAANAGFLKRLGLAQNNLRLPGSKLMCQYFVSSAGKHLQYLDLRHNITTFQGHLELRKMMNMPYEDDETNKGWMMNFGERQLMLNAL